MLLRLRHWLTRFTPRTFGNCRYKTHGDPFAHDSPGRFSTGSKTGLCSPRDDYVDSCASIWTSRETAAMKQIYAPHSAVILATAIMLFGLPGCVPKGVAWLPDSTAVVFTDKTNARVICYDLTRKARRVIVDDTKTKTPWPAISADGKRLAVAKVESSWIKNSTTVTTRTQVIIYDLHGQELQRSGFRTLTHEMDFTASETGSKLEEAALSWSGPASKILLVDAIYDCVRDVWTTLPNLWVIPSNTPIRPDGKGFLALTSKSSERLVFVGWDGAVSEFAGNLPAKDVEGLAFEWNDKVARITTSDGLYEFDTQGMRCTFKAQRPWLLQGDGKPDRIHRFRSGTVQLCVFERKLPPPPAGQSVEVQPAQYWVEVQIPASMKRYVLLHEGELGGRPGEFFPSPDGRKVAFVVSTRHHEETIIVVNDSGVIEARIAL